MAKGLDFSYWRTSGAWLKSQGFTFVCRYLSHDPSKNLSAAEYADYKANGIAIVLNFEDGAQNMLGGYAQGVADATLAKAQAEGLGLWPAPIFFSADFDVSADQQAAVNSYLQGCAAVMGAQWVGAYGGYYTISRAFNAGVITFGWQTYAWSNNQWELRAQLRQVPGGDGNYDLDEAMVAEFGQVGDPTSAPVIEENLDMYIVQGDGNDSVHGHAAVFVTNGTTKRYVSTQPETTFWSALLGGVRQIPQEVLDRIVEVQGIPLNLTAPPVDLVAMQAVLGTVLSWSEGIGAWVNDEGKPVYANTQPAAIAAAVKSAGLVGEPGPAGPEGPAGPAGANGTSDSALLVTGMQAAIAAVEGAK